MSVVLDSSVVLAWCFSDENTPAINALMRRVANEGAAAPSLWRFEMANALQVAVRKKRIDEIQRDRMFGNVAAFDIRIDAESDAHVWSATTQLAARHDLTVYDAAYLELAQRRRLPLATLDGALIRAAGLVGVRVLP